VRCRVDRVVHELNRAVAHGHVESAGVGAAEAAVPPLAHAEESSQTAWLRSYRAPCPPPVGHDKLNAGMGFI
jgi:hypothetical protein